MSLIFNLIVILVRLAPPLASLLSQLAKFRPDQSSGSIMKKSDLVKKPRIENRDLHEAMVAKWNGEAVYEARFISVQTADSASIDRPFDELRKSDGYKRE
ncbi:hypothetical protein [uncultured Cohaesibacter sp.]|uniref:hypothetical protein n=1 Tax=uncultured Cohaesibacter sp. TaxID=1002546 RepID=UPI002AAB0E8A|nr:hypothetical protein [uncultured Cohaesibacter sp.]